MSDWILVEEAAAILGIGRMPANRLAQTGAVKARKSEQKAVNGRAPWEFDRASCETRAQRLANACPEEGWMPIAEAMFRLNMTRHGIKRRIKMGLLDSRQYGPPEKLALYVSRAQVEAYLAEKPVYRSRGDAEPIEASELFIAWFAGFFDGEGTVGIRRPYRKGSACWYIDICLPNTFFPALEAIASNLGGAVRARRPQTETRKETRVWGCSAAKAYQLLRLIEPHLIVKQEQARLAIKVHEFLDTHRYGRWSPMPEWVRLWLEEQKRELHRLNHRGSKSFEGDDT